MIDESLGQSGVVIEDNDQAIDDVSEVIIDPLWKFRREKMLYNGWMNISVAALCMTLVYQIRKKRTLEPDPSL